MFATHPRRRVSYKYVHWLRVFTGRFFASVFDARLPYYCLLHRLFYHVNGIPLAAVASNSCRYRDVGVDHFNFYVYRRYLWVVARLTAVASRAWTGTMLIRAQRLLVGNQYW